MRLQDEERGEGKSDSAKHGGYSLEVVGRVRPEKKCVLKLDHALARLGLVLGGGDFMHIGQAEARELARRKGNLRDERVRQIADGLVCRRISPVELREPIAAQARAPALVPPILREDVPAGLL